MFAAGGTRIWALVGLGSNMGDRASVLHRAVASLRATRGVVLRAVSSFHETAPVGGPEGQGAFLNGAVSLETDLEARDLLDRLRSIEREHGRIRRERWGQRTLDLDLLLYGREVIRTSDLVVPHPRMAVRRFVLGPASEIAAEAVEPLTGRSILDLLGNLDRRPSHVCLIAPDQKLRSEVMGRVLRALSSGPPSLAEPSPRRQWVVSHLDAERFEAAGESLEKAGLVEIDWALDLSEPDAPGFWPTAALPPGTAGFRASDKIAPTFLAAFGDDPSRGGEPGPPDSEPPVWRENRPGLSWHDHLALFAASIGNPPILWIEARDASRIAEEILAACVASRTG